MKFYDTCSLLRKVDSLFDEENFVISSVTLKELENIKTSVNKDAEIKYSARKKMVFFSFHLDFLVGDPPKQSKTDFLTNSSVSSKLLKYQLLVNILSIILK